MIKISIPRVTGISISQINSDLKSHLSKEFEVVDVICDCDVLIQHYVSGRDDNEFAKKKILIQPIDGTSIDPKHLLNIKTYDKIITPSTSCKKILISSGIEEDKIHIIPNYYKKNLFETNKFFDAHFKEKKYTFYTISTGITRKNVENILLFFLKTFTFQDNVRLIIKLARLDAQRLNKLKDLVKSFENAPEVVFFNEFINEKSVYTIMNSIDCYICLSYMEGFCIPLLQAAVLKKDIIALNSEISGYMDFLNTKNSIMLPVRRIEIDKSDESLLIWGKDSFWEEPIYDEYMVSLRQCYDGAYKFDKSDNFEGYYEDFVMLEYFKIVKNIL